MITISHLGKKYGSQQVLKDINFSLKKGEVAAIIGPSGTGKSTLLRCLNYLEVPSAGTIRIGDIVVNSSATSQKKIQLLRKQSSFVFQNYALFANKTVLENIAESRLTVWKEPASIVITECLQLLKQVGLADKKDAYPGQLSGGQQQRVGIARAMACRGPLMLLDEPTSALDPAWVNEVLELIRALAQQQQTMIIATHEMQFAREVADKIIFMENGHIIEQGKPAQIFSSPKDSRTANFLSRELARTQS